VLTNLAKLRPDPKGPRPLADLLALQLQWSPGALSLAAGLEAVGLSLLGPPRAPSIFLDEDPTVAEEHSKELPGTAAQQQQAVKAASQPSLELLRNKLYQLFHEVLANKGSRGPLLNWFAAAIGRNSKRTQLQANQRLVARDGFMLNLTSVLQHLCGRVEHDKVDATNLHRPGSRVDIVEESRLNASS
jgi:ubiquitin conjugation factor E4 B